MKTFALLFAGMAIWGFSIGANGGALIALAMIGVVCYGAKVFAAQDAAYNNSPLRAVKEPCTLELLDSEGCECSAHGFHGEISKPDLEK